MNQINETYSVGEKVRVTEFYLSRYSKEFNNAAKKGGVVVHAKFNGKIKISSLSKEDRLNYQQFYGNHEEYPFWELIVNIGGTNYLVSQLGFEKDT